MRPKKFAVVVFVALAAVQGHAQTNLTGTWAVTLQVAEETTPPQPRPSIDAVITQTGEKLTFDITSPFGQMLLEGTVIKNQLAATYHLPIQGQTLEVKLSGVADGDTIKGSLEVVGKGELKWIAARKSTDGAAPAASPSGAAPANEPAEEKAAPAK